jgi:vancomycin resistance protein YoaR
VLKVWLRRIGWVVATVAALVAAVLAAWQIDLRVAQADTVSRNVTVAGVAVGGLGPEDLARRLAVVSEDVARSDAMLRTSTRLFSTTGADIGVALDVPAVTEAAMTSRPGADSIDGLREWFDSFFTTTDIPPAYTFDQSRLETWVGARDDRVELAPTEPSFTGREGTLEVTPGENGLWLEASAVGAVVADATAAGEVPIDVSVPWSPLPPTVDAEALATGVASAEDLADRAVSVRVEGSVARIGSETVRRWIDSVREGDSIGPVLDPARAQESLERLLADVRTEGSPPVFTVVDGEVEVEYGDPPLKCCGDGAGEIVVDAVLTDHRGAVALPLVPAETAESVAEGLGVVELVGEFTTNHACCESRVQNIQRMADLVRGQLILPGETFSVNEFTGQRTREKGFVPAGTIIRGRLVDTVGGGVSQFATTMFNAAFFAGLDFVDYKAHSLYISRYPYGREATLNYPDVDLEVHNSTPYGMLIWTSYTDTSITVQLWSTPYYEVEETGQDVSAWGRACTYVETFRRRTMPEGGGIDDSVFAIYRPAEGIDCNGNVIPPA